MFFQPSLELGIFAVVAFLMSIVIAFLRQLLDQLGDMPMQTAIFAFLGPLG